VRIKHSSLALVFGLTAVLLLGCRDEEIGHYTVPKEPQRQQPARTGGPSRRLLAAILPEGDHNWFFKFIGPTRFVSEHKDEFEHFLRSIRLTGQAGRPVQWDLPEGWREVEPNRRFGQVAAFQLPEGGPPAVTISQAGGDLLLNVNRWRTQQLGLPPITEADLPQVTKDGKINGIPATFVDMATPGGEEEAGPAPPSPLTYDKPANWKEIPPNRRFGQLVKFQVEEGDRRGEASIARAGGGLLANVNIWRQQLGLAPTDNGQLQKDLQHLDVAGAQADYVDLTGPESAGAERQRILVLVVRRGPQTWFFKLLGPAELVARQKPVFEAFVKSVHFQGVAGHG
jgi:hypothetical protein